MVSFEERPFISYLILSLSYLILVCPRQQRYIHIPLMAFVTRICFSYWSNLISLCCLYLGGKEILAGTVMESGISLLHAL